MDAGVLGLFIADILDNVVLILRCILWAACQHARIQDMLFVGSFPRERERKHGMEIKGERKERKKEKRERKKRKQERKGTGKTYIKRVIIVI
jgi:hypothetical protein